MARRADRGCKSFLCVLVFFVAVCSFSHCTEPARSQTSNSSVKLKGHGTFSQNRSKADRSGRLIIGRSPLKGAILKEVKLANDPLDVDTDYQSDPAWEAPGPAHVYGTASYDHASAQKLLQMNPKVECTPESMKLMVLDPGSTPGSLYVDRGSLLAPLPLSKLPTSCGYSLTSARKHLILVAPYDGCFVTQEDDCYVLPLQWCGLPVRMSCPAVRQSNPPVVSCRAEGLVVTMEWIVSVSDIKVKLNDQWEPLLKVSSTCGFSVVAHSEGVVISARYAPCVQMKDGMFTFELSGDGEITCTIACPPQLKPAQSPNQQVPSSPWSLHPPTLAPPNILIPSAQVPIYPQYPWVPGHPFQTAIPTTSMPPSKEQGREPFNQFPLYPWLLQPPVTKPYKTHQVDQPFYQYPSKPYGLPLIPDEKPVQHKPAILSPVTHAPRGPEQQPIYPYPLYTQQPTYEEVQEPNYQYPVYPPSEPIGPTGKPFYQYPTKSPHGQEPSYQYSLYPPSQPPPVNKHPGEMPFDYSGPPVTTPPEMHFDFLQTPPVNKHPGEMQFYFSPEPNTEPPVMNPPEMHVDFSQPSQPPQITADCEDQVQKPIDPFPPEQELIPTQSPGGQVPGPNTYYSQQPATPPGYVPQKTITPGAFQEPQKPASPQFHKDNSDTQTPQTGITYNSPVLCPENCISGFSYCCPSISFHQHYHYYVPAGLQLDTLDGLRSIRAPTLTHPHGPDEENNPSTDTAVNSALKNSKPILNTYWSEWSHIASFPFVSLPEMQQHYVQLEPVVPTASYPETKPIYYNTYDQQKDYFVQNEEPVEDLWLSASEHQHSYMQDFGGLPTSDNNDPSLTPVHRHNKSSKHEHPVDSNSEPDGYEGGKDKLFKSQPRASYPVPLPNEEDQLPINQELTESVSLDYPVPNGHNSPTLTPKPSLSPSNTSLTSLKDEWKSKTLLGSSPSVPPQVSGQPSQMQDSELEAYHQSKGQKTTN